jgi:hypothetical protein
LPLNLPVSATGTRQEVGMRRDTPNTGRYVSIAYFYLERGLLNLGRKVLYPFHIRTWEDL